MRRAGRIALNVLTVLSLLLLIPTACLWVRALYLTDEFVWSNAREQRVLSFRGNGIIWFRRVTTLPSERFTSPPYEHLRLAPMWRNADSRITGWPRYHVWPAEIKLATVDYVDTGLIPAGWLICALIVRYGGPRRRAKPGTCVACDYDLTGNVSGVCPECGTPVSPATPGERMGKPARKGAEATEGTI